MARVKLRTGEVVEVPDGLNKGGRQDWLIQQGATPEQVGIEPDVPDPGNRFEQFVTGMQSFARERGVPLGAAPAPGIAPPDTGFVTAGKAFAPVLAGTALAAVPGLQGVGAQVMGQAALGGGLEALREGSTGGSVALSGALAGGGTFAGQQLGRFASGALSRRVQSRIREAIPFPKANRGTFQQSLARASQGAGGLNSVIKTQIRAINSKVGKVFNITDDATLEQIDEVFLQRARTDTNLFYKAAQPNSPVDVSKARAMLSDLQERGINSASLDDALKFSDDVIEPEAFQSLHRTVRDLSAEMKNNPMASMLSRRADEAVDLLDESSIAAGGDKGFLSAANQKFKMLATLEEINAVVEAGEVPAGELVRKMGRDNFKGFGRRLIAEGAGKGRLLPEIADLLDTAKTVADFTRQTSGGSATAGRESGINTIFSAAGSLAKGRPVDAAGNLVTSIATRMPGLASIGSAQAGAGGGVIGAAGGQEAARRLNNLAGNDEQPGQ